ncbi:MAG: cysteine methyltransferase [Proteobacteria bacterium]|nr:MAG: cysteine methyltransferase [Pseudomonadota bacterium]
MYSFQSPFGVIDYDWHEDVCDTLILQQSDMAYAEHDDAVSAWLSAYFSGKTLSLPTLAPAKTSFQTKLRHGLCAIPHGEVKTYGELAKMLNTAPRALGQALGANPLPILIPCHRVIAANHLGGFHYGKDWKKALLNFERE